MKTLVVEDHRKVTGFIELGPHGDSISLRLGRYPMKVAELMQAPVVSISGDATVGDAITMLADAHVLALAVTDGTGRLIGVLSTSDVLEAEAETEAGARKAAGRDVLLDQTFVRDLMTARPLTISPEAETRDAALQMLYTGVHRLFVELNGELVGVISQTDLVRAMARGRV